MVPWVLVALAGTAAGASPYVESLTPEAQGLLLESMKWMDDYYDANAGYLHDFSNSAALRHETRSSVWYALGLLARNEGNDAAEADKIITNTIRGQYRVESEE